MTLEELSCSTVAPVTAAVAAAPSVTVVPLIAEIVVARMPLVAAAGGFTGIYAGRMEVLKVKPQSTNALSMPCEIPAMV